MEKRILQPGFSNFHEAKGCEEKQPELDIFTFQFPWVKVQQFRANHKLVRKTN